MTDADPLLYERRGPAAWITLNRPGKLNAMTHAMVAALSAALERAGADDEVKVVVVTGAGRAFCAGYDLSEEGEYALETAADWHRELAEDVRVTMALWSLPKPTIAAVRGWCLGGGCDTAMACDMIVAADDAHFGEPEIRYGAGPATLLMPFVLGQKKTSELLFTGDSIDAAQALALGLVNTVVEGSELEPAVDALVGRIAPTPLEVLRLTKLALIRAYEAKGLRAAVDANLDLGAIISAAHTPEQREFDRIVAADGLKAALAWRDARYAGGGEGQSA